MNKLSTENLNLLPNQIELKGICKAISTLEAIICPEWEYRYYSYQKNWSETEEFCEMRNGEGDHLLILFGKNGNCINGYAHESKLEGVPEGLPKMFNEFIFGEPVKSIGTTFCIWQTSTDNTWKTGNTKFSEDEYKDGSSDLLHLLDGSPSTYKSWAEEYYVENFDTHKLKLELVEQVYKGTVITQKLVKEINPDFEDFEKLKSDLEEIGYAYGF